MLVVVDVVWIVGASVAVGAWAPHWPDRWVDRDRFPVCRWPGESVGTYRRLGLRRVERRLPEGGAWFGGRDKSRMTGISGVDLRAHLCEVRRAEWVHWASIGCTALLVLVNPWWIWAPLLLAVVLGNLPCLLVLRRNRLRLGFALSRRTQAA